MRLCCEMSINETNPNILMLWKSGFVDFQNDNPNSPVTDRYNWTCVANITFTDKNINKVSLIIKQFCCIIESLSNYIIYRTCRKNSYLTSRTRTLQKCLDKTEFPYWAVFWFDNVFGVFPDAPGDCIPIFLKKKHRMARRGCENDKGFQNKSRIWKIFLCTERKSTFEYRFFKIQIDATEKHTDLILIWFIRILNHMQCQSYAT